MDAASFKIGVPDIHYFYKPKMKYFLRFLLTFLFCIKSILGTSLVSLGPSPIIQTSTGPIQGITTSYAYAYLGVPFSGQPLRFAPPFTHPGWSTVLNASTFSAGCIEYVATSPRYNTTTTTTNTNNNNPIIDTENGCLTVNIFMPFTYITGNPVIIWIHGGGFIGGNGNSDLSYFANQTGSLIVSVNYRLGTTGYFNLPGMNPAYPTPTDPNAACPNVGLLDQQFALAWTYANAAAFGANNSNTLIHGQSAGGSSIMFQLTLPGSYSYYKAAIPMSPGAPVNPTIQAQTTANDIATAVNCPSSLGYTAQLACLRNVDINTLITASINVAQTGFLPLTLGPSIDNSLVLAAPATAFLNGNFNRNAHIVTTECLFEGDSLLVGYNHLVTMNSSTSQQALLEYARMVGFNSSTNNYMASFYTNIAVTDGYFNGSTRMWGDGLIACSSAAAAHGAAKYSNYPTYRFLWNTTLQQQLGTAQPAGRSTHGTDLPFYFNTANYFTTAEASVQQDLYTWLISLVVNNDVNANGPRGKFRIDWPAYDNNGENTLLVVNELGEYSTVQTWQEEYCNQWWIVQP